MKKSQSATGAIWLLLRSGLALVPLTLPAGAAGREDASARPAIERAWVVGGELRVIVANRGDAPSGDAELVVTTRAAGRLVGSSRLVLGVLPPGAIHEKRVQLSVWGASRPMLRAELERQGCCTTRVWLEPGGRALLVRHSLGAQVAPPPQRE